MNALDAVFMYRNNCTHIDSYKYIQTQWAHAKCITVLQIMLLSVTREGTIPPTAIPPGHGNCGDSRYRRKRKRRLGRSETAASESAKRLMDVSLTTSSLPEHFAEDIEYDMRCITYRLTS